MKKLLIVDDNLDFLGFLVSILKQHFEVYEASGVKEALQVLENTEIEAVCADFNMKDGTGLDLLRGIRQKKKSRRSADNHHAIILSRRL